MNTIPIPQTPCEVLCFYPVEIPVRDSDAYVFITVDVVTQFVIHTGTETDREIETVLKHIALLLQDKDFKKARRGPFTLVLHKYQQHRNRIEELLAPHGGTVLFDDAYVAEVIGPVIAHMFKSMAKGAGRG